MVSAGRCAVSPWLDGADPSTRSAEGIRSSNRTRLPIHSRVPTHDAFQRVGAPRGELGSTPSSLPRECSGECNLGREAASGSTRGGPSPARTLCCAQHLPQLLLTAAGTGYMMPDSTEPGVQVTRELVSRTALTREDGLLWHAYYALNLAFRGHVRHAARALSAVRQFPDVSDLTTELALLGAIPADTADALLAERLQRTPYRQPGTFPKGGGPGALGFAPPWWAARSTFSLLRFVCEPIPPLATPL